MNPNLSLTLITETRESFRLREGYLKIVYGFADSPYGLLLAAFAPEGLCDLGFVTDSRETALRALRRRWPTAYFTRKNLEAKRLALHLFYSEESYDQPVFLVGSPFRLAVWESLLEIPEGGLLYYSELAEALGMPESTRSIASAVADNPIALLIPCHRIIPRHGGVGQYRWGSELKRRLILGEHLVTTAEEHPQGRP